MMRLNAVLALIAGVAASAIIGLALPSDIHAADARDFNAGNIIDDSVFTNSSSMSAQDIQAFLESKVSCDTWGTKTSELGGGTRRQWMAARGINPPFRCATDYRENPATNQNNYGKDTAPAGSISAAEIIYNYSRQFNINPQVIIATLQKENGMITDEWPTPKQFSEAMGFGCPDNRPAGAPACDPQYNSFSTQVYEAARHFRGYLNNNPGWWIPFNTGWNSVAWNPNSSCGRGDVYIENRATVALYSYTPYQPNQAAKNAQYGTGDGCSAYGNRNFYLFFTDWFGSVRGSVTTTGLSITKDAAGQMFTGQKVDIKFTLKNQTKMSYTFSQVGVAIRGPQGQNLDPGWSGKITIAPGATYTYSKSFTPSQEGEYQIYMSSLAEQDNTWRECHLDNSQATCYNPHIIQHPIEIIETPKVTRTLNGQTINELRQKQGYTVSYTLRNSSQTYSAKPGSVMIAGRTDKGVNRDLARKSAGTLDPGQQYTYSASATYNDTANTNYTLYVSTTKDGGKTFEERKFKAADSDTKQSLSLTMKQGVSLIEGPSVTSNGVRGAKADVKFRLKNYTDQVVDIGRVGLVVRGPQGQNLDTGWFRVDKLSPTIDDGVYTYQASFWPSVVGTWSIQYTQVSADMRVWNGNYPASESSSVKRTIELPIKEVTTLHEGPVTTNKSPHVAQAVPVSFKIKTLSDRPIDLGRVGLVVRGPQGQNLDTGWFRVQDLSTAKDGGVYTYQASFYPNAVGRWTIDYTNVSTDMRVWTAGYPTSDSPSVKRTLAIDVKPQVTITSGVSLTGANIGERQASFTLTNHGITSANLGRAGLAVRSPTGANRDAWWEDFMIPANSSKTHTVPVNFNQVGKWSFSIESVHNGVWSSPIPESSAILRHLVVEVK